MGNKETKIKTKPNDCPKPTTIEKHNSAQPDPKKTQKSVDTRHGWNTDPLQTNRTRWLWLPSVPTWPPAPQKSRNASECKALFIWLSIEC